MNIENHTTFKLRGEVVHVKSNWHSNFVRGPHFVLAWAAFSLQRKNTSAATTLIFTLLLATNILNNTHIF